VKSLNPIGNTGKLPPKMINVKNLRNNKVMKIRKFKQYKKRVEICLDPHIIYKLYWEEKKSLPEIGNIYNLPSGTLHGWMKRHGIPTRSRSEAALLKSPIKIPPYRKLFQLYQAERKSTSQIAKQIGVCKFTVRKWLKKYKIPLRSSAEGRRKYPRKPFSGDEKEKAYLLGFSIGDLHVRNHHQTIEVIGGSTHPAFIDLFYNLFSKYGHCTKIPSRNKLAYQWKLRCGLDYSFNFLLKNKKVTIDPDFFYPFLAGYSDAEGYWKIGKTSQGGIQLALRIGSKDQEILKQIKIGLEERGYSPTIRFEPSSGVLCLSLNKRAEVLSIAEKILPYSRHKEKLRKIRLILKIGNKKHWKIIKNEVEALKSQIKREVEICKQKAREKYEKRHLKQS
jgi:hypothetical protein